MIRSTESLDPLDPPEHGWPWQLSLCDVLAVKENADKKRVYKIRCRCCGYKTKGFTPLARVSMHFHKGGTGIGKCGVGESILVRDHSKEMSRFIEAREALEAKASKCSTLSVAGSRSNCTHPNNSPCMAALSGETNGANAEGGCGDLQPTIWWASLSKETKVKFLAEAHEAWDMFFFVHNLPFWLIETPEFLHAIMATKKCPVFKPVTRKTLCGSHLDARSADADVWKQGILG